MRLPRLPRRHRHTAGRLLDWRHTLTHAEAVFLCPCGDTFVERSAL